MDIRNEWVRTSSHSRTGDKTSRLTWDEEDGLHMIIGRFDDSMTWDERALLRYEITRIDPNVTLDFGHFPEGMTDPDGRSFQGWGGMVVHLHDDLATRRFVKRVHERGNALHRKRRDGAPMIYSTVSRRMWIICDTLALHAGYGVPREW